MFDVDNSNHMLAVQVNEDGDIEETEFFVAFITYEEPIDRVTLQPNESTVYITDSDSECCTYTA